MEEAWTGQLNVMATDDVLKERAKMIASTVPYYSVEFSSRTYLQLTYFFFILSNLCEFKR